MKFKVGDLVQFSYEPNVSFVIAEVAFSDHYVVQSPIGIRYVAYVTELHLETPDPLYIPYNAQDMYEEITTKIQLPCSCNIVDIMKQGCTCNGV